MSRSRPRHTIELGFIHPSGSRTCFVVGYGSRLLGSRKQHLFHFELFTRLVGQMQDCASDEAKTHCQVAPAARPTDRV